MDPAASKGIIKANMENLKQLTRLCERKCIGNFENKDLELNEDTCLNVCVKKYFSFQEIPKKVYQDDTISKSKK